MEDSSREEKQNFLRENILEKGYDVNIFINFLKSKKGGDEGADISSWSMQDLQNVVQEFISLSSAQMPNEDLIENENSQSNIMDDSAANSRINETEINNQTIEDPTNLKEEDFGLTIPDFIECKESEKTELCKYNKIEITVSDPQKVDKGFFSKAYIDFAVATNPCKLLVRRQHAEFVWLRERLSIIFNTNVLPRLPKKGKVNGDPHIQKRMRNLEKFLNYLIKDPLIKSSQILFDFLSIENEEDYNKRKRIYNKMRTPTEFNEIKSVNGKTRLKITKNKEKHIDNIRDNAALNETALKKINTNFKIFREEMNSLINRVLSFSPLFDKLVKISQNFVEDEVIIESYRQMKNIFISWADVLKKQNSFFCNDIKEYLKIISGNYHHIRDLAQEVENIKTNYYKMSKNLIQKKTELFKKGEFSNWQLDPDDVKRINDFYDDRLTSYKKICFKETNNAIANKKKYGYFLNRLISEYVRMRNINAAENKDKLKQFSQKEAQIVTDFFKNMGEIIIKMDGYVIKDAGEKLIEKSPEENNNINVNEQKEVEEEKEKEKEKEQGITENEEKNSNDNIENNVENNVENKNEINENNNKS
jgi:hypothetical protein